MVDWSILPGIQKRTLEADSARGFKEADAKGKTITTYNYNKEVVRIEHSNNM